MAKGKQVKTINRIYKLALQKRSLYMHAGIGWKRIPAGFVINYSAGYLLNLLRNNSIFEYHK